MSKPFKLRKRLPRRTFLQSAAVAASALALAGCDSLSRTEWFPKVLDSVEPLERGAREAGRPQRDGAGVRASRIGRPRSAATAPTIPDTAAVQRVACRTSSPTTRSNVGGLCERRASSRWPSCARCRRARRSRATIASKAGAPSASGRACACRRCSTSSSPRPEARYVMFYCADPMAPDGTDLYYESIDFDDARHEQTILAYDLNDAPLPVPNGAPLRLRVERQLGYKHAKFVTGLEFVSTLREHRRRQGRLLGGPGLPVVRGDLTFFTPEPCARAYAGHRARIALAVECGETVASIDVERSCTSTACRSCRFGGRRAFVRPCRRAGMQIGQRRGRLSIAAIAYQANSPCRNHSPSSTP